MKCGSIKECFWLDIKSLNPGIGIKELFFECIISSGTLAVVMFRLAQYFYEKKFVWRFAFLISRINQILNGFECNIMAEIDCGLFIPHSMNIVIGIAKMGKNITVYNGVTLGARVMKKNDPDYKEGVNRYPIIEDNVVIYSGAKLIGPIHIGKNAVVGANAVVVHDVPEGKTVVGIPARILKT